MTDGGSRMRDDGGGHARPRWLHDDDAVHVDVASLQDFAERIKREIELNFQPSVREGIQPMMKDVGRFSPFGRGGLIEGQHFGAAHGRSVQAAGQLLGEAMKGLMAIQIAAQSIAMEYATGDALGRATVEDVASRFDPLGEGLLATAEKNAAASGGSVPDDDPHAIKEYGDSVAPANSPGSPDGHGGEVRGTEYVAKGTSGEYVISGDNEGVEARLPGSQAPKP